MTNFWREYFKRATKMMPGLWLQPSYLWCRVPRKSTHLTKHVNGVQRPSFAPRYEHVCSARSFPELQWMTWTCRSYPNMNAAWNKLTRSPTSICRKCWALLVKEINECGTTGAIGEKVLIGEYFPQSQSCEETACAARHAVNSVIYFAQVFFSFLFFICAEESMYLAGRQCFKVRKIPDTNEHSLEDLETRVILQVCTRLPFLPEPLTQLLFLLYHITALPLPALNELIGLRNVCVYHTDVHLLPQYSREAMHFGKQTQFHQPELCAVEQTIHLPKSWLGPLAMGGWGDSHSLFSLIPPWLTNCCFWPHCDPGRQGGEVTRRRVLTCSLLSLNGPMLSSLRGASSWPFLWQVLLGVLWRPTAGILQTWLHQEQRASFARPHSALPEGVSTAGISRTIFQPRAPQLDLGIVPLDLGQRAGSVVPNIALGLLAQPRWFA